MSPDDSEIVKTDQSLSKRLFSHSNLFTTFYSMLLNFAVKIVKQYQAAEDVVSGVFVKLLEKSVDFESPHTAKSWLYKSTERACIRYYKKNRYLPLSDNLIDSLCTDDNGKIAMAKETALVEIKKAIKLLPKERRKVFILYYIRGLDNPAIARKLHITDTTVRNQKSRALEFIRKRLRNYQFDQ